MWNTVDEHASLLSQGLRVGAVPHITPDHPQAGTPVDRSPMEGAASITLGDILRQARERQALTLDEVARRTGIARRHLEALEQNSLAGLPP